MNQLVKIFKKSNKIIAPFLRQAEESVAPVSSEQQNEVGTYQERPYDEVPIHLKPYDAKKYEQPSSKLKVYLKNLFISWVANYLYIFLFLQNSSGYALLDVEPFPRAKIMKLGYIILDKVKQAPEDSMYRIFTEEKIRYIMEQTDEISDIKTLEQVFGKKRHSLHEYK